MLRAATSQTYTIPAPTGGWNARDPLDGMAENDAIRLINFYPDTLSVRLRNGFRLHSSVVPCQTLAEYSAANGTKQLIAFGNNSVFNASTYTGSATDITNSMTITLDKWQTVNVRSSATNYLIAVNGTDQPIKWDGSTLSTTVFTGVTDDTLIDINYYKTRPYLVEKSTASVWYGGADAIAGALTKLDLGSIFQLGGYLLWTRTWSKESNNTLEDLFVACSSNGEILLYTGLYPGDSTWGLVGRHYIPRPIGIRSVILLAGEPHLLTIQGIIPLSQVLHLTSTEAYVTDKIRKAFSDAALSYKSNFGWQILPYYQGYSLWINVPTTSGITSEQYVMNLLNGSWCRFTGMNASCWTVYNDNLYFAGNAGNIYQADITHSDNGQPITGWEIKQAFNYFQDRSNVKRFLMAKPILTSDNSMSFSVGVDVDFKDDVITDTSINIGTSGTPWGSPWGSPWSVETPMLINDWYNVQGIGRAAALKMKGSSQAIDFSLQSTTVLYEPGCPL